MGVYINPTSHDNAEEAKRVFLNNYAKPISEQEFLNAEFDPENIYIAHMDNGMFTAVGVMYSEGELKYVQEAYPNDNRPHKFYVIAKDTLIEKGELAERDIKLLN